MTQSKSRVVSISSRTPKARATPSKLFVLDTNVLMHDPTSLYRFEEHDIFLPICTLEELDNHKKGTLEVNRNARQASRFLDGLVGAFDQVEPIHDQLRVGKRVAGGFGVGAMDGLIRALQPMQHAAQVVAICGRNEELKKRLWEILFFYKFSLNKTGLIIILKIIIPGKRIK